MRRDPTARTFLDDFDPMACAPTQHAPLLTIIGTHDQYFNLPGINDRWLKYSFSNGVLPPETHTVRMTASGSGGWVDNILSHVNVRDTEGFTISSKMYYKAAEMGFFSGFTPRIQHYLGDGFAVPSPPSSNCARARS